MTIGEYIILFVIVLLFVLKFYLENYLSKKAQNKAEKEDSRVISYEAEKGKNLATKEDIAEITKVVEDLKSGVLFEHQRKHDFIQKRMELFISVLNHAEDIQSCAFLLFIYVQSQFTEEKIYSLIQRVNDDIKAITHDSRFIMVSYENNRELSILYELKDLAFKHGREICAHASNAATSMATISVNYRLFKENGEDPAFLKKSLEAKTQLEQLRKNIPYTFEGEFVEKTTNYVVLLRKLFNKDFHIYY